MTRILRTVDPATGNVSGCALAFEALLRDAGFPDGLFPTLSAGGIREFTNLRTYWVSVSATPAPGAALTEWGC